MTAAIVQIVVASSFRTEIVNTGSNSPNRIVPFKFLFRSFKFFLDSFMFSVDRGDVSMEWRRIRNGIDTTSIVSGSLGI